MMSILMILRVSWTGTGAADWAVASNWTECVEDKTGRSEDKAVRREDKTGRREDKVRRVEDE